MQVPPLLLVFAASAVAFAAGQAQVPTAHAQPPASRVSSTAPCRAVVQNLHVRRMPTGTEITGRIVNTGPQMLTYTSVTAVFTDAAGQEIGRWPGYLTAGPLGPGQAAGFRAAAPDIPAFHTVSLRLLEAGHPVILSSGRSDI